MKTRPRGECGEGPCSGPTIRKTLQSTEKNRESVALKTGLLQEPVTQEPDPQSGFLEPT